MAIKTELIKLSQLENNEGQIAGINANPRDLDESGFGYCLKSIKHFPEMIEVRTLVVVPYENKYIVIGGNQRLRALRQLGYVETSCAIVKGWTVDKINEFIIKDNLAYGAWNWDMLANEWEAELLADWGLPIPFKPGIIPLLAEPIENVEVISQPGYIWLLDKHKLICGPDNLVECDKIIIDWQKVTKNCAILETTKQRFDELS